MVYFLPFVTDYAQTESNYFNIHYFIFIFVTFVKQK